VPEGSGDCPDGGPPVRGRRHPDHGGRDPGGSLRGAGPVGHPDHDTGWVETEYGIHGVPDQARTARFDTGLLADGGQRGVEVGAGGGVEDRHFRQD